jgi:hypothetical protein
VQFQIILTNTGLTTIVRLPLRDTFDPSRLSFTSANPPPDSVAPGELRWNDLTVPFGDLPPGRTIVVTLNFRAVASTETQVTCNWAFVEGAVDDRGNQLPTIQAYACVEISQPCSADSYEPNDSQSQAAAINFGDEVRGLICPQYDHDFFVLSGLATKVPLRIQLYDLPADYQLSLYGPDGSLVANSSNAGTTAEEILYTTRAAGDHFIRVAPNGDAYHPTRAYTLRAFQSSLILSHTSGRPGTRMRASGKGLFPGVGATPARIRLYLDEIVPGQELDDSPMRPDGGFDVELTVPAAAVGTHALIAANVYAGELRASISHPFVIDTDDVPISMDLWLDDAWLGDPKPGVIKVVGDNTGTAGLTILDVVVAITAEDDPGDVAAEVTIDDDLFGPPERAARRNSMGGALTELEVTDHGDGDYSAQTTLTFIRGVGYYREVVFRFRIPTDLADGIGNGAERWVNVWGAVWRAGHRAAQVDDGRRVRLRRDLGTLIITSRSHLYDQYTDAEVNDLLGQLYYHSQTAGLYATYDRPAAIYYVDDYSVTAAGWNNGVINWASEANANTAANAVDNLIEDWYEDTHDVASYLLIVGDDNIVPFYRVDDPADAEDDYPTVGNNHPVLNDVVSHGYLFTDNRYADMDDTDWDEGEIDLAAGRIVGPTAAEMTNFLLNSLTGPAMDTGNAALGSYGGRDFVLPGADNDVAEALEDDLGLDLRNDTEAPITVEDDTWDEADFRGVMNLSFDLFHFQGHSENDGIEMANGNWMADNEIPNSNVGGAISNHRPFFYFGSACRAGFSLGTAWNDSLVYSLAHHNASGVIASAGLSKSDWDNDEVYAAEQLANAYWQYAIRDDGTARPLGAALRDVKQDFDPGAGWEARERRTMLEYTYFGVPWMGLPVAADGDAARATADPKGLQRPLGSQARATADPKGLQRPLGSAYVVAYELDASHYQVKTVDSFHLVEVEGFHLSKSAEHPVVPVASIELPLPPGASVTNVSVFGFDVIHLGQLNIPIFIGSLDYPGEPPGHYEQTPDSMGVYPQQFYTLDVTALETYQLVRVQVIPLVYDAVSDQAALYGRLTVQVTYDAPQPVAITQFEASRPVYALGEVVDVAATIVNVSDAAVEMTGTLRIVDAAGAVVAAQAAGPFTVSGGGSHALALSWAGGLVEGGYTAALELWQGGFAAATATTSFAVSSGGIVSFSGPALVGRGEAATFSLRFRNERPEAADTVVGVSIYDAVGTPVADLAPQLLTVAGGGEASAEFTWTAAGLGTYRAAAIAVADGRPYGPAVRPFAVAGRVYLPVMLK